MLNHISFIRKEQNRLEIINKKYEKILSKYEEDLKKQMIRELIFLIEKVKTERKNKVCD